MAQKPNSNSKIPKTQPKSIDFRPQKNSESSKINQITVREQPASTSFSKPKQQVDSLEGYYSQELSDAPKNTQKTARPRKNKKSPILRFIRFVSAGILAFSAALAIIAFFNSRLLPSKIILIALIAIAVWTLPILATLLRKKEKTPTSIILSILAMIFSIVHILAFNYLDSTESFLNSLDQDSEQSINTTSPVKDILNTPFIVYISGKDASDSLSDVNQLMAINPETHKILIVNTPRDYYVQLASQPASALKDKLTHAGTFGLKESIRTMELLYDIEINYYIQINFESLIKLVDTIGGINVNSEYAFEEFKIGDNHLNGNQALRFSRNRKSFSGGDRTRGENQQRVINAIIQKLSNPNTLANYPSILESMKGSFTTNFGSNNISRFAKDQIDKARPWNITSYSVNGEGIYGRTYSYPKQDLYVMVPDQSTVQSAKQQMTDILR